MTGALLFVAGLAVLLAGAEALVRGAARLATALGVSALGVGLTVVAFGTSAPELAVSVQAAFLGRNGGADIALGNVVGSNIFNVLFILGLSALVAPLAVSRPLVTRDVPILIAVSVLVALLGLDGRLDRLDGLLLFAGILVYTLYLIVEGRRARAGTATTRSGRWEIDGQAVWPLLQVIVGLVMLVLGARWLLEGAVGLARAWGVSELVIGLTLVAAGTSLPELATSVVASLKGQRDIAIGNIVGSNIFNILSVLGLSAIVAPDGLPVAAAALDFDIPVMIAVAVVCLPVFVSGYGIARWEGAVFFGYYLAYTAYLALDATRHALLPVFNQAMWLVVIPVTVIVLAVSMARFLRARSPKA